MAHSDLSPPQIRIMFTTERPTFDLPRKEVLPSPTTIPLTESDLHSIVLTLPAVSDIIRQTGSDVNFDTDGQVVQLTIADASRIWLLYKLRDRSRDGPGWSPSRLTSWEYGGPDDTFILGRAVEQSSYWLDPRHPLTDIFTSEQARFVNHPFDALQSSTDSASLLSWIAAWQELFPHPSLPYPGYYTLRKIPHLSEHILDTSRAALKTHGYDYLTSVPSWYHVAKIHEHSAYHYTYQSDRDRMASLTEQVEALPLTKQQRSWLVMAQFWIPKAQEHDIDAVRFLPQEYILHQSFPLSPARNLWMHLKL